jgi:hypothetical protein
MRQSSVIFFFLFASFVIFITLKGELPVYLGLLLKSPGTTATPGTQASAATSTSGPSVTSQVANYEVSNASQAAQVFLGM